MSVQDHKRAAPKQVRCRIITVSDTRLYETDHSGQLICQLLLENGHEVVNYLIVKDEPDAIRQAVLSGVDDVQTEVVLVNGGTGIAKRDITIETIKPMLEKEIVGFGELFRMLSYTEDIGPAAMLSRAIAGTCKGKAIFSMPGSTGAVKLAMTRLILPELTHILREIQKDQ
jgi:molybdenum cofactor biosynthesis protein B